MSRLLLGVDGGASKTFALVGDGEGRLLGFGRGGGANHQVVGAEAAFAAVGQAVEQALDAAGVTGSAVTMAVYGLAGADLSHDFALLEQGLRQRGWTPRFIVKNDTFVALRGGTPDPFGVVALCGSGTNTAARGRDGREAQVGGMGYTYGDFGGGGDLAREALHWAFKAADGRGPDTGLRPRLLAELRCPDYLTLKERIYLGQLPPGWLHRLAPSVFAVAAEGDAVAQDILLRMGREIGLTAVAAARAARLLESPFDVVLAGSVWLGARQSPLLIDGFRESLHRATRHARPRWPLYQPVVGAYLLAAEAVGAVVDAPFFARLEASMPEALAVTREEIIC